MLDGLRNSGLRFLWISVIAVVLDQITKNAVVAYLELYQAVEITPFFNLVYVRNYGAAFSFLYDAGGWQRYFLSAVAFVVSIMLLWWMKRAGSQERLMTIAFAFILGGAIGNLIDRLTLGYVVDFLDFHYANAHWPAFNVADSSIFIGACLLIIDMFKNSKATTDSQ